VRERCLPKKQQAESSRAVPSTPYRTKEVGFTP
jgi:hypothetical protein